MENDTNVKNWIEYWKTSGVFFDTTSDQEQAQSWNSRWSDQDNGLQKNSTPDKKRKRMDDVLTLLEEAGCRVNGARVLDIGCGPGAFSIGFAKAGAKVTALDISGTALKRLKTDAQKEGLTIETIERSWWSADIDELKLRNKFDLVFVTSTPAVKNAECLDRMIRCSKGFCYYSFFIRQGGHNPWSRQDMLRKILKKEPLKTTGGKGSMFINAFMYLYLKGHHPLLRILHTTRKKAIDPEGPADSVIRSLERLETCTDEDKKKISEYYETSAVEGKYETVNDGYSGMMVWNVKYGK